MCVICFLLVSILEVYTLYITNYISSITIFPVVLVLFIVMMTYFRRLIL